MIDKAWCIMMVNESSTLTAHTKIQADALNKVQDIKAVCLCDRMQGKTTLRHQIREGKKF
jgi:hypothetical protein